MGNLTTIPTGRRTRKFVPMTSYSKCYLLMLKMLKISITGKSDVKSQTWFQNAEDEVGRVGTRVKTGYLTLSKHPNANKDVRKNLFSDRV